MVYSEFLTEFYSNQLNHRFSNHKDTNGIEIYPNHANEIIFIKTI